MSCDTHIHFLKYSPFAAVLFCQCIYSYRNHSWKLLEKMVSISAILIHRSTFKMSIFENNFIWHILLSSYATRTMFLWPICLYVSRIWYSRILQVPFVLLIKVHDYSSLRYIFWKKPKPVLHMYFCLTTFQIICAFTLC